MLSEAMQMRINNYVPEVLFYTVIGSHGSKGIKQQRYAIRSYLFTYHDVMISCLHLKTKLKPSIKAEYL